MQNEYAKTNGITIPELREREALRLSLGIYQPLPSALDDMPRNPDHFVHMSSDRPGTIAYTPNDMVAARDAQKRTSIEGYITKFFRDEATHDDIERWTRAIQPEKKYWLFFAKTRDEIRQVYTDGPGFDSCMRHPADDFESYPIHPVEVYGDSDLQIACLMRSDYVRPTDTFDASIPEGTLARCIVWPERKYRNRIFSSMYSDVMADELRDAGFKYVDDFSGAKLTKLTTDGGTIIAPYLDCGEGIDDYGSYIKISECPEFECKQTSGTVEESERYTCEYCEDSYRDDDDFRNVNVGRYTQYWCDCCVRNEAFYCHGTGEYYADNDFTEVEVNGLSYCEDYAQNHFAYCEYNSEWVDEETVEVTTRIRPYHVVETWALSVAEDHAVQCEVTSDWFADSIAELVEVQDDTTIWNVPDIKLCDLGVYIVGNELWFEGSKPVVELEAARVAAE